MGELKSAYELAMERLAQKDKDEGVQDRPLTEAQRAALAEARNVCEAKLAEREVLFQSKLRQALDPGVREALELDYRRDRERLIADRDARVDRIRRGEPE